MQFLAFSGPPKNSPFLRLSFWARFKPFREQKTGAEYTKKFEKNRKFSDFSKVKLKNFEKF
jgi:hypothetical protein